MYRGFVIRFEFKENQRVYQVELDLHSVLTIGSCQSCEIQLNHPSISSIHAEITLQSPNKVILRNLNETNGTWVNQEQITTKYLTSGDLIQFGDVVGKIILIDLNERDHIDQSSNKDSEPNHGQVLQILGLHNQSVIAYGQLEKSGAKKEFTVGFGVGADCPIAPEALPSAGAFKIAELCPNGDMLVHIPTGSSGTVLYQGTIAKFVDLRRLAYLREDKRSGCETLRLPVTARCRFKIAEFDFVVSALHHPGYADQLRLIDRVDQPFLGSVASILCFALIFITLIGMIPASPYLMDLDRLEKRQHFIHLSLEAIEPIPEKADDFELAPKDDFRGRVTPHPKKKEESPFEIDKPKPTSTKKSEKRAQATQVASMMTDELTQMWGDEGDAVSPQALRQLVGRQSDEQVTIRSHTSTSPSPDETQEGTFKLGRLSTIESGPKRSRGPTFSSPSQHRLVINRPPVIPIIPMPPVIKYSDLSPAIIKRTVMSRAAAYRHCYERQLQGHTQLGGVIKVEIKVASSGRVILTRVIEDTMKSKSVEQCLLAQLKQLRFPRSPTRKMSTIRYPFRFASKR